MTSRTQVLIPGPCPFGECGETIYSRAEFIDHMFSAHQVNVDAQDQRVVDVNDLTVMGLKRPDFEKFLGMTMQDWQWSVLRQLIGDPT